MPCMPNYTFESWSFQNLTLNNIFSFFQETEYDDVVTCKHSYDTQCHTTYTTDFEPQQEEVCEENFIKECFIEYKKTASEESVEFCHTPLVCEGQGPEECRTVYESQCETR